MSYPLSAKDFTRNQCLSTLNALTWANAKTVAPSDSDPDPNPTAIINHDC